MSHSWKLALDQALSSTRGCIRVQTGLKTSLRFQAKVPSGMEVHLCRTQLTGEETGLDGKTMNSVFDMYYILAQTTLQRAEAAGMNGRGKGK